MFFQLLSHSLCLIILLALSYVPISTANLFSIISSFTCSPRTPFPVTYVNPCALLIAAALHVSSAGRLRPGQSAVQWWRRVLVMEVALLQCPLLPHVTWAPWCAGWYSSSLFSTSVFTSPYPHSFRGSAQALQINSVIVQGRALSQFWRPEI